jgi:hypothetical protein
LSKELCCTCPHIGAETVETIKKLNFEVFEHPPYSSHLATMDSHLFRPLKQAMDHGPACVACLSSQKFFYEGKRSLCSEGKSALKRKERMLKNGVRYLPLFQKMLNIHCG